MAVKQYSRLLILQLCLVLLSGWIFLVIWSISQWIIRDYQYAYSQLNLLVDSQRQAIMPVYQGSLLSTLPIGFKPQLSLTNPYIAKLAINPFTVDLLQKCEQFLQLILLTSQYMLIKLIILLAAMPLFALAILAGLVDGLNQRAIRTACLGRESSYVFHQLNRYFKRSLVILLIVWLSMPVSITPALVFIPISLLLGLMVAMTASRFKKYL